MAFFVGAVCVGLAEEDEFSFPVGTSESFVLSVSHSDAPKAELVDGLNALAADAGFVLVKVTANPDDPSQRDLVWFGSQPQGAEKALSWFDPSMQGSFVASTELGLRPLDGYYAMSDCPTCRASLTAWAQAAGATIEAAQVRSVRGLIAAYLTGSGAGLALLSVVMLMVSVVITWFAALSRSRSLRLLGGVRPWQIHADDVWALARIVVTWSAIGWLLTCCLVLVQRGAGRLGTFVAWSLPTVLTIDAILVITCFVVSWLTRPTVSALAERRPPVAAVRRLSALTRFGAVLLAAAALPYTVHFAQAADSAQIEASRWHAARGAVTVSLSSAIDTGGLDQHRTGLASFVKRADAAGISALSFTLDQAILMPPEDLGPYDHVIMSDPAFLSLMSPQGGVDALVPVAASEIPAPLLATLRGQFEVWTPDGTSWPEGVALYTYTGSKPLPAIGLTLTGGATIQASHPLVIVVDHPLTTFTAEGFTLSAMVNGNLVFTDADQVRALLHAEGLDPLVISLDNVADETLDAAQSYGVQARLGVVAVVLTALAVVLALLQAAQVWAGTNQRRIFMLHTAGRSFWSIQRRTSVREGVFILLVCSLAAVITMATYRTTPGQAALSLLPIVVAYSIGSVAAHNVSARSAFRLTLSRRT